VLSGLNRQTDSNFEVLVADDGSTLEHQRKLLNAPVARNLKITHIWHPDIGFTASRARNRGVAASVGTYLIFLDGDCVPGPDFVAQHRRLAQPGCLLNGSRVLLSPAFTQQIVQSPEPIGALHERGLGYWLVKRARGHINKLSHMVRGPDGNFRIQSSFYWRGIRSCNMSLARSDFLAVDGFDESFAGWGHEDADFVLRLHHAGIQRKNGFLATEVFHLWHPEAKRNQESANAQLVVKRMHTQKVVSDQGFAQTMHQNDAVITKLG
jgi:predicted glycosyltransferase involved in capsule biosynthesis